jgi:surface protein
MIQMFLGATSFNQPIGSWDVSNVINLGVMFYGATSFNQPIENWDVSNVTSLGAMFYGATSFNQPIGNWDVSSVDNMNSMFEGAHSFNQDLSTWCVINVLEEPTGFDTGAASWISQNYRPVWGTCPPKTTDVSVTMVSSSSSCVNNNCTVAYGYRIANNAKVAINFDRIEVFVNDTNINNYNTDASLNIIAANQSKSFQITFPNISTGKTLKIICNWSYEGTSYSTVWTKVY